jgi:hypothetical protein
MIPPERGLEGIGILFYILFSILSDGGKQLRNLLGGRPRGS